MSVDVDDGTVNWVWQSETNATAFGRGGVVMADDGVSPIVAGIAFGNLFNLSFTYWEVIPFFFFSIVCFLFFL